MSIPASAYGPSHPPAPERQPPGRRIDGPKCWRCSRTLADYLTTPFSLRCPKCKAQVTA